MNRLRRLRTSVPKRSRTLVAASIPSGSCRPEGHLGHASRHVSAQRGNPQQCKDMVAIYSVDGSNGECVLGRSMPVIPKSPRLWWWGLSRTSQPILDRVFFRSSRSAGFVGHAESECLRHRRKDRHLRRQESWCAFTSQGECHASLEDHIGSSLPTLLVASAIMLPM